MADSEILVFYPKSDNSLQEAVKAIIRSHGGTVPMPTLIQELRQRGYQTPLRAGFKALDEKGRMIFKQDEWRNFEKIGFCRRPACPEKGMVSELDLH